MRPESIAWERAARVRGAAQGWRRAGLIDSPTEQAIRAAFPDPCVTPSPVWRVLTAGMVAAVILCSLAAFSVAIGWGSEVQVLLFLLAGLCLVTTDQLERAPRFTRRGAAGMTAFLGVCLLLAGSGLFLLDAGRLRLDDAIDVVLVAGCLVWGAACWRWGSPAFAALAAVSLFVFLGRLPQGRALWLLAGAALAAAAARRLDARTWAPSHRLAAAVLVVAGIGAAYAAVNVYSLDGYLVERLARFGAPQGRPSPGLLALGALATATVPLAVLAWGARSRRTFLLDTGIVLVALSLMTLRHYVHLAPLWTVLTLSGGALVVLALAVERALRRAPEGVIAGYTAGALFSDERRQHALAVGPVVATFAPPAPAADPRGFAGEGGRFGGGGASEKF
jgi:hypothetical protein